MKSGTIALIGKPNVGKSTLFNQLLGEKISITSKKAQTTRNNILGVLTQHNAQFVFVDTPGFQHYFKNALYKQMNQGIHHALNDVDVIVFLVEAKKTNENEQALLQLLPKNKPVILAINKIDCLNNKNDLLPLMAHFQTLFDFAAIVPIASRLKKESLPLLDAILPLLPNEGLLYEEETLTDKSARFLASEFIREKVFRQLGDELPYGTVVEIEKFEELPNLYRIFAAIVIEKQNHKAILIGKNGNKLKRIASDARKDLEKLFQTKLYLEIFVKVKSGWANDVHYLQNMQN